MKIKSKLLLVFALCLAVLFAVSLVACNDGGDDSDDGPNNYETSTYTVTFNTDSKDMTSISNPVIRNVPYGSLISEPTDANGNKIIPYKRGYIFQFWKKSNGDEFDFTKDTITANTTLTASYMAIKYYHTAVLTDKYVYDRTEIDPDTDEETDIYVKVSRADGEVNNLSDAELDKSTTTLTSTYAVTNSSLPCPTSSIENNKFCFWYYVNKDGKPIQFSKWAADGATTVGELTSYSIVSEDINDVNKGLELYAMFTNDLPTVTVRYLDSADGTELFDSEVYTFGQNVEYGASVGPKPEKDGFAFVEWYYEVEQTANGVTTTVNTAFVFDDGLEDTKPTSPMDAAGAEDNFKPVELVLKAKWIRQITITSLEDYKNLYEEVKALTKLENLTDEEQEHLDGILNANISINAAGGIDFGNESFEPLFDKAHPFKGTIDGLTKTGATTSVNTLLTGGLFGDSSSASVFGYNEGTIKNLDFKNIGLQIAENPAVSVQIGVITTDNAGTIESCTVTMDEAFLITDLHTVMFGGITAVNHGSSARNGIIRLCTVNIGSFNANCKALTFGGIAGESNSSTSLVNCTVNVEIEAINCVDDGISSNGKSSLTVGGLVGFNSGAIRLCKVDFNVKNATSLTEFVFGGVAGVNNGSVRTTYATATLGKDETPVSASGSISFATCIGGLIGKNGGYVLNCYATANLFVQVEDEPANSSNIFVGGLVGSNYSDLKDSQETITESGICAINYSYSLGEIVVKVKNDIKSVNVYVGGIAGRNSHKKVASLFSTVKISVTNDGNSYLGHIFGKMVNDVGTNGKIFYANDSVIYLTKDGKTYEISGDGSEIEVSTNFENIGEGTASANFKKAEWVVGSDTAASPIGFGGTIWEVKEGEYPSFLENIYDENTTTTAPDSSEDSDDESSNA